MLQKGGVLLIVGGFACPGTPMELAEAYRDGWFAGGEFCADDAQTGEIGNGIPAAIITYSGVVRDRRWTARSSPAHRRQRPHLQRVRGGGSLEGVSADIDQMLSTAARGRLT